MPGLHLPHLSAAELRDRVQHHLSAVSYDVFVLDKQISPNSVGKQEGATENDAQPASATVLSSSEARPRLFTHHFALRLQASMIVVEPRSSVSI
jgi:hypothetical protein